MTPELKPCPFCGSDELTIGEKMYHGGAVEVQGMRFWRVECLPCDARTGDCFDGDAVLCGYLDGRKMAIAAWNRRAI